MSMQITRQADYAIRAVLYLAQIKDGSRTATSIVAKEQHIPPSFLAKIVTQLSLAGVLHTSRGAHGGVMLAREPKDISLLDVIQAIDGPLQLSECVEDGGFCTFERNCPIRSIWSHLQEELAVHLQKTDFAQLAAKREKP